MNDLSTLAGRLKWVMDQKGWKEREYARKAGLASETHVGLILNPKPGTRPRPAAETLRKLASAGGVNVTWLQTGEGPIAPDPPDELASVNVVDFLNWYYATPALKQCVDAHAKDLTVADLLRYRVEPARGGEADPEQVYRHIQQLRLGPIAGTVDGEEPTAMDFAERLARQHDAALDEDDSIPSSRPRRPTKARNGKSGRV